MDSDQKLVSVEVDGVVYRGHRSVRQDGNRVLIDGMEVGVDVDTDGERLPTTPEPVTTGPAVTSWWRRFIHRWCKS